MQVVVVDLFCKLNYGKECIEISNCRLCPLRPQFVGALWNVKHAKVHHNYTDTHRRFAPSPQCSGGGLTFYGRFQIFECHRLFDSILRVGKAVQLTPVGVYKKVLVGGHCASEMHTQLTQKQTIRILSRRTRLFRVHSRVPIAHDKTITAILLSTDNGPTTKTTRGNRFVLLARGLITEQKSGRNIMRARTVNLQYILRKRICRCVTHYEIRREFFRRAN